MPGQMDLCSGHSAAWHGAGRHLRILNQRRSKRPRLKESLAPYSSAVSSSGGKKAMKSRRFHTVVSVLILLSASCRGPL